MFPAFIFPTTQRPAYLIASPAAFLLCRTGDPEEAEGVQGHVRQHLPVLERGIALSQRLPEFIHDLYAHPLFSRPDNKLHGTEDIFRK